MHARVRPGHALAASAPLPVEYPEYLTAALRLQAQVHCRLTGRNGNCLLRPVLPDRITRTMAS